MRASPGREACGHRQGARHAGIARARGMRASPGREACGHRQGARHADIARARGMRTSPGREACGHRQGARHADIARARGMWALPGRERHADVVRARGMRASPGRERHADVARARGMRVLPGRERHADIARDRHRSSSRERHRIGDGSCRRSRCGCSFLHLNIIGVWFVGMGWRCWMCFCLKVIGAEAKFLWGQDFSSHSHALKGDATMRIFKTRPHLSIARDEEQLTTLHMGVGSVVMVILLLKLEQLLL
ncbi:hypothetical protein VNO80_06605 [Phaseolus coccineus]|uniref:Uncharacterized protein n=1 Tax=Phaseolus coccineus TaxID=3886 RepID=A0AAN9NLY9_PHACN